MTPCKSKEEYINLIALPAQRVCKRYGFLPSVLIAQSCLENGYGMAKDCYSLIAVNNMVGQKSELLNKSWVPDYSVWPGKSITKNTPEQYGNSIVRINDQFRVFDSIEQSLADYLLFLTYASNYGKGGRPKYGGEVLALKDPETLIRAVASRGYATGQTYPASVMRVLRENNLTRFDDITFVEPTDQIPPALSGSAEKESEKMAYTKSPLAVVEHLSPNNSGTRKHAVDRITPHCFVGNVAVEDMLAWLANPSAEASANYCIGVDGRVGLGVEEINRAWTSSNSSNDNRAITIECASAQNNPYTFKDAVYAALLDLCTDICRRYAKKKLLWLKTKEATEAYNPASDEMVLSVHRWYANKACPGKWLMDRMSEVAATVTARLGGSSDPTTTPSPAVVYKVQLGAYQYKKNAKAMLKAAKDAGYTKAFITPRCDDGLYRVQVGAYSIFANAEAMEREVEEKGLPACIKEYPAN